ncbi:MAG TPA: FAD-dependent oxidoreductase [Spirochaetota bacterium]|nr:FAD-dependent oxidoreductase [Spirochaetota bacterium]
MEFTRLFEPVTINGVRIKNRIVMPAMGLAYTDRYEFNERYRAFYRERAHGGVGLMIIGPVAIDMVGSAPFMPGLFLDKHIEPLKKFNDEMHRTTDVKLGTQLFHMGRNAFSIFTGLQPIGPSPVKSTISNEMPREMNRDDIEEVKESFARGATRARDAGFDYIEILGCTGYLISQFLSPLTNHRTDEYGGTLENRMRFGLEVIRAVREAAGKESFVGIRVAGNDFLEGGHTGTESALFCAEAEKAGVDAINVTGGWHETNIPQLTTDVPPGTYLYLARGIKEKVSIPVFASNRLGDPCVAERALRSGSCDLVCWGRPLIADPDLPNKAREGRLDEAVFCMACNQGCFDSIFLGTSVCCVLNPRVGREHETKLKKTRRPKKILVAGGGPAGMEFALIAAQRGHRVILYEKQKTLGGQINLAMTPPRKAEMGKITETLSNLMRKAGVEVKTGRPLTAGRVKQINPDILVVATGAVPSRIQVKGIDKAHVASAWDILTEKVPSIGSSVVIVGGSATGCETAHYIAALGTPPPDALAFLMYHHAETPGQTMKLFHSSGRTITIIEMAEKIAANVGKTARWSLLKSLRLMGVSLCTETRLLEIKDHEVIVETRHGQNTIPASTVVLATGVRSENSLAADLGKSGIKIITLGDARSPRKITDAIREGFDEAMKI